MFETPVTPTVRPRRPRRALVLALALLAAVLAPIAGGAPRAEAAGGKLSGTIQGEDGRYISAMIGIELFTSGGTRIGMNGQALSGGYSLTVMVNAKSSCCFILPGTGSDSSSYNGYSLTKTWTTPTLPSNADYAYIEAYPKRAGGLPNTDTSRYGEALRRPVDTPSSGVNFKMPMKCGTSNNGITGKNGRITGTAYWNGQKINPSRVGIWSTLTDTGSNILGWGLGQTPGSGAYNVEQLYPGTYTLRVTANGVTKQVYGVKVQPCATTIYNMAVSGSLPTGVPTVVYPTRWLATNSLIYPSTSLDVTWGSTSASHYITGDWNGDGEDEMATFKSGSWSFRSSNDAGATQHSLSYGKAGDIPVKGDWDGDGDDDPGVFRGGVWYLRKDDTGSTSTVHTYRYGISGDKPVPGDWNGDGVDEPGVFRKGTWYMRNHNRSGGSTFRTFKYGTLSGDIPVVGDWTGDNRDEPGIFRKGEWYLRSGPDTSGSTFKVIRYGVLKGDIPAPGDFDDNDNDTPGIVRR